VEKQKETVPDLGDKNQKKKLERLEEQLKINNRELSMVKMKSMMTISFAFMALLSIFNSMLEFRFVESDSDNLDLRKKVFNSETSYIWFFGEKTWTSVLIYIN
jgi:hypothetical protein